MKGPTHKPAGMVARVFNRACGVGVFNAAVKVLTHQPTDIVCGACNRASGMRMCDEFLVISHQPADILVTGDLAGGVDVADASLAPPRQPSGTFVTRDPASGVGVFNSAAIVLAHQSAGIFGCACHRAGGVGIFDAAAFVIPHQPADISATVDLAGCVGVADAAFVLACQTADPVLAGYFGIHTNIADTGSGINGTKQADFIQIGTVDSQVAEGMSEAIKLAAQQQWLPIGNARQVKVAA